MFTKKGAKKKTSKGKPFGGKGAAPFAKKTSPVGSSPPMGPEPDDEAVLDARIGQTFRGGGPGGGKSLPSRPPWA